MKDMEIWAQPLESPYQMARYFKHLDCANPESQAQFKCIPERVM